MLCHWFNWSILACRCFVSVSLLFFISGGEFTSFVCEAGESKNVFFLLVEVLLLLDFYWLLFLSLFGLVVVMVCCVHDTHLVNTHTGPQNFPETGSRSLPAALWEAFRKSFSFVRDYTFPPSLFSKCKLTPAQETLKQTVCYKCGSDSRSHLIEDCFIIARCLTETWSYSIYR